MKTLLAIALSAFLGLSSVALAQSTAPVALSAGCGTGSVANGTASLTVDSVERLCVQLSSQYPANAVATTGNATGTTGAVVGTLAAAAAKTTYICGLAVSAIGGTAAISPITVAGLIGSSMVFQFASAASGATLTVPFTPCIPASAINTAITITTTADGSASAVSVNSWGFQQ